MQAYVLDKHLRPLPAGIAGQLYISGAGITAGYLNRPDLTEDNYCDNPFAPKTWPKMYKTGDLAYKQQDGNIIYLGRADNQIKLRGFRIELGEIENLLSLHKSVSQIAVVTGSRLSDTKDTSSATVITNLMSTLSAQEVETLMTEITALSKAEVQQRLEG